MTAASVFHSLGTVTNDGCYEAANDVVQVHFTQHDHDDDDDDEYIAEGLSL